MNEEKRAFLEKLFKEYSERLFRSAYKKTNNKETAMDIMFETFLTAAEKIDTVYDHPNKGGWLYSTLNNKILEWYKTLYIKDNKSGEKIPVKLEPIFSENGEEIPIPDNDNEIEKLFCDDDFQGYSVVLKEREIKYIIYKFKDGISTKKIAEKMDISYTNATTIWSVIKKKLKKFLDKNK